MQCECATVHTMQNFPGQKIAAGDADKARSHQGLPASAAARGWAPVPTTVSTITTAATTVATAADWLGARPGCSGHLDPLLQEYG